MEKPVDIRIDPTKPIEFTYGKEGASDQQKFQSWKKVVEFLRKNPGKAVFARNIHVQHVGFLNESNKENQVEFVKGSSRGRDGRWNDWVLVRTPREITPCDVTGLY